MLKLEKVFFMMIMIILILLFIGDRRFWSYLHWILPTNILLYTILKLLRCDCPVLFCCFSGGKDSCYNMMQCVKHGHVIVALANLKPSNGGRDIVINVIGCTIAFF